MTADSPGPKPRFSLVEVARAGIRLADEQGLERVTLQAVAKDLGLTTTALYRYVDAKDTLLELMVDVAIGPAPHLTGTLADLVRTWVEARWRSVRSHPWLTDVGLRTTPRGPDGIAWQESLVAGLAGAGVADPLGIACQLDLLVRGTPR
ncbi:TetR/AcrR family transcriptional regulator [Raineyella fluvialis]|nr:helix-turn-helix domain-containing protein [Raineyella fluvialis]